MWNESNEVNQQSSALFKPIITNTYSTAAVARFLQGTVKRKGFNPRPGSINETQNFGT